MSEKSSLRPKALVMVLLWAAALPCAAITPVLDGRQPDAYSVPKQSPQLSGTIDSIDRAAQSIVIDGKTYHLPLAHVVIHTADPSTVAGRLVSGTRIRFRAGKAQPGQMPAVTEIWFMDENDRGQGSEDKGSEPE